MPDAHLRGRMRIVRPAATKRLYTVGYESCEIDEFIDSLVAFRIKFVADVRRNPVSRKPGFAKTRLGAKLNAAGIEYMHLPALGVPTEWRKLAKAELITRAKMFRDYQKKVLPAATAEISFLKKRMKESRTAVLCYEADASDCHRSYVAEKVTIRKNIVDLDMLASTRRRRHSSRS